MSLCLVERPSLACIDGRLAQSFRKSRFPIHPIVAMRKICHDKLRLPKRVPKQIVDHSSLRNVPHVLQIEVKLLDHWLDVVDSEIPLAPRRRIASQETRIPFGVLAIPVSYP